MTFLSKKHRIVPRFPCRRDRTYRCLNTKGTQYYEVRASSSQAYDVLTTLSPYAHGMDCQFLLQASSDFSGLDIFVQYYRAEEWTGIERNDVLTIKDLDLEEAGYSIDPDVPVPPVARLAGIHKQPMFFQTGPRVFVQFETDNQFAGEGFRILVRCVWLVHSH